MLCTCSTKRYVLCATVKVSLRSATTTFAETPCVFGASTGIGTEPTRAGSPFDAAVWAGTKVLSWDCCGVAGAASCAECASWPRLHAAKHTLNTATAQKRAACLHFHRSRISQLWTKDKEPKGMRTSGKSKHYLRSIPVAPRRVV